MRIAKLKISGFRSIKNAVEIDLKQITAIMGANNVGKSNILSAINTVLGKDWLTVNAFDEDDVFGRIAGNDILIDVEFEKPFAYYPFKDIGRVDISKLRFLYTTYKSPEKKGQRRLEKKCLDMRDKEIMVLAKRPKRGEQQKFEPLTTIPQDIQESIPVIYINTDRSLKQQLPAARNSLLMTLLKDINEEFMRTDSKIAVSNSKGQTVEVSRKVRFDQCISAAITALRTDQFVALEKSIQTNALLQLGMDPERDADKLNIIFNPLTSEDFYRNLEVLITEESFTVKATELGAGFQNALLISILKAFEERRKSGAIFLIEEPEMFLHPQMQRSLYKTLRKIGEENQVIYVTHSPHFVTIPNLDEIVLVKKNENGTSVVQSNLVLDDRFRERLNKDLDSERNELFFSRKVLVVEGPTEKLAIPEFCKKVGIDLDCLGICVVEAGGKRNIISYVDIAMSFKIPVGFVYDTDSSDFKSNRDEELKYNQKLDSYREKGVFVLTLKENFEGELRAFFGNAVYEKHCQLLSHYSKSLKPKLMATNVDLPIPNFFDPLFKWLKND